MSITVPVSGLKVLTAGAAARSTKSNRIEPTNADLGFVEAAFNAVTDQDAGTHLFTAQIRDASVFTLQGYSFSNFRRTSGFSKLTGGTATDTARPFTSASMVLGDAGSTTCTISVDFAGPTSGTISAVIPGSIEAPPGTQVLARITLINYGGSTVPLIFGMGHVFPQGAVPSAFTLAARRQDTQAAVTVAMDGPASWSDGSLAWTGLHFVEPDVTIAAGSSLVLELYGVVGSRTPSATGYDPWSWLTSNTDLKVELTGMSYGLSTTAEPTAMSPSQRDIVLNDHIAVSTRRTRHLDHPRVQVLKVWGMADGDGHLKGEHFITLYRDDEGEVLGARYECVVAQDWWVNDPGFGDAPEGKTKRHYFATLKDGSDTLQAYTGDGVSAKIQHPYHSAWSTVQRTGSSKGLPWWIAGSQAAQPTLRVTIEGDYWLDSGLLAPYETGVTVGLTLPDTNYDPGRAFGFQAGIDSTGGSWNRGWLTVPDVLRLLKQDEATDRNWRTSALAGLHCPQYRARNHLTDSTIGDVTNLPIPFQVQSMATSASTGLTTGQINGLGTRQLYQKFSNSGMTISFAADGSTSVNGGYRSLTAHWSPGSDNSHAPPWGYLAALLTGRRVFREVAIDSGFRALWNPNGGCIKQQLRETGSQGRAAQGWPVRYHTPFPVDAQARDRGWTFNVLANGWRVCEDGSPIRTHMDELLDVWVTANKLRLDQIKAQSSTAQADRRLFYIYTAINPQSWEHDFIAMGICRAAALIDGNADLHEIADWVAARAIRLAASDYPLLGASLCTEALPTTSPTYAPPSSDFAPGDSFFLQATVDGTDNTVLNLTVGAAEVSRYKNTWRPSVDDPLTVSARVSGGDKPTNLSLRTTYYVKEVVSPSKIRISATEGGSAIAMTSAGAGTFCVWGSAPSLFFQEPNPWATDLQIAPYDSNDDYLHIYLAAIYWGLKRPDVEADSGDVTAAETTARAIWDAWRVRVDNLALSYSMFNPAWMLERP